MMIVLKTNFIFWCLLLSNCLIGQMLTQQSLDLMPMPKKAIAGKGSLYLSKDFTIIIQGNPNKRIYAEANRFLNRLGNRTGIFFNQNFLSPSDQKLAGDLEMTIDRPGQVKFGEEESYTLEILESKIILKARTDIGAIRGLESLLQLVSSTENGYFFPHIKIEDSPRFPWRGLMIDVARHFQPVDVVKRNIDGMAAVKLNVLHLHLSDDQGFRVESKIFPNLTGKGSDGFYYTHEQIKDIVEYADQRGIRVYPEFDVPGHASAILTAYPEYASKKGSYSLERNAGVFDPTLDPTNPETYDFLNQLFSEMASLFKDDYFHVGGDENEGKHWDENEEIQAFMKRNKFRDNHDLQAYFNGKLLRSLEKLGKKMVGWDEIIHPELPNYAIIQSWRGLGNMQKAAKNGYKTMLSNGYYIDLMHATEGHYLVDPLPDSLDLSDKEKENIIGGEATMWGELITSNTIDSRIWPRTAAIAERFWSPKYVRDVDDMYRRLSIISLQLEQLSLEHLSIRDVILRNLAQQYDVGPIQVLAKVCQPLQGYARNPGGTMYQSYSPFMLFADACIADPPDAYHFNSLVKNYLGGNSEARKEINKYLTLWSSNHHAFKQLAMGKPSLHEISQLSANLSMISNIGKEALQLILDKEEPAKSWIENSEVALKTAREQGGRTELKVVKAIEFLVKSTINNN